MGVAALTESCCHIYCLLNLSLSLFLLSSCLQVAAAA